MNELITTNHNDDGEIIISGRELHEFLEVKTDYKDWFPRMVTYGFEEGLDFSSFLSESTGGRPKRDHHIKLDMAKEIAMIQRTEKGKQARQYFLQLEKMWNSPEMVMKRALQYADQKVLEMKLEIEKQRPKVLYAEAVTVSKDTVLVKDLAATLKQKGIDIGEKRLFEWLRENGYLCKKKGEMRNMPTQKSLDLEIIAIKHGLRTGSDGEMKKTRTPKITGKGQIYFINKFLDTRKEA
ncbi:phage antirepressor KilAC domain-containing protein [Halalkalibacter krulwichiae]|uniref:Phage antirepressor protein KilAC domain protein n=1 Tax=Halalkalibacter krulwichiae TaxID=199441 RepID=A0A1X9M5N7_9BACI|nr:phage antirepressor KilAC domain-containing protein [Halalkalibacter krulwichiae]ARK28759.1 Phage antirepressor protein KilAC domain protein [Halalkalibacter krulwichiae]